MASSPTIMSAWLYLLTEMESGFESGGSKLKTIFFLMKIKTDIYTPTKKKGTSCFSKVSKKQRVFSTKKKKRKRKSKTKTITNK